jgi:hypothetical protein
MSFLAITNVAIKSAAKTPAKAIATIIFVFIY